MHADRSCSAFADADRGYLSRARPLMANARYLGDYDHLARVREWALVESADDVAIMAREQRHERRPPAPESTRHGASDGRRVNPAFGLGVRQCRLGQDLVLSRRVIRLLLAGVDPSRILCLTFTKAAAAEMANRVFDDLGAGRRSLTPSSPRRIDEIEGARPSARRSPRHGGCSPGRWRRPAV